MAGRPTKGTGEKEQLREVLIEMIGSTYLSTVAELVDSIEDRELRKKAKQMDMGNDRELQEELESHLARARNKIIMECATSGDVKKMEFAMKMIGTEQQRQRQNSVYKSTKKEKDPEEDALPTIVLMDATSKEVRGGKD